MTYARYGTSNLKYGNTSRLYGLPPSSDVPDAYYWTMQFDWDNDGILDPGNEAVYAIGFDSDRGHSSYFETGEHGFDEFSPQPMIGRCTIKFTNDTGRFSVWSTSSDSLGYNLAPGRMMRVAVRRGTSSTDNPVFAGFVKTVSEDEYEKTVTITCVDGVEYLQEHEAYVALNTDISNPTTPEEAKLGIVSSINYPFGYAPGVRDNGYDIPYYFANGPALKAFNELSKMLVEITYVAADGKLSSFYPMALVASSDYTQYDGSYFLKDIEVSLPWENIKTVTKKYNKTIKAESTGLEIWNYGSNLYYIDGSTSVELWADYRYNSEDVMAVPDNPVSGTDYIVNTLYNGTGTNITSDVSIVLTDYGRRAKLTITNANASAGYFQTFKLRGQPYPIQKSYSEIRGTDYLGVGDKILTTTTRLFWKTGFQYLRDSLFTFPFYYMGYPHSTKRVKVKIDTQVMQFYHDIGAFISFDITKPYLVPTPFSVQADYNLFNIWRIRHRWKTTNGQAVETEWTLHHGFEVYEPTEI